MVKRIFIYTMLFYLGCMFGSANTPRGLQFLMYSTVYLVMGLYVGMRVQLIREKISGLLLLVKMKKQQKTKEEM